MKYDLTSTIRLNIHEQTSYLELTLQNMHIYSYSAGMELFLKWGERQSDIQILIGKNKGGGS